MYDIVQPVTGALGTTSVNASTFNVECGAMPGIEIQPTVSAPPDFDTSEDPGEPTIPVYNFQYGNWTLETATHRPPGDGKLCHVRYLSY